VDKHFAYLQISLIPSALTSLIGLVFFGTVHKAEDFGSRRMGGIIKQINDIKMTTLTKLKFIMMLMAVMFLLPLLYGCQEEGQPDEESGEISLNFVATDISYISLPLIGTPWKLVGFVDGKKNRIKLMTPFRDKSYTLNFKENGALEGFTSSNIVFTAYSFHTANENGLDLSLFGPSTFAGETDEGYLYTDLMKQVNSYRISSRGLELYYDPQQYLLFQPKE
jgi:hypothetical protein